MAEDSKEGVCGGMADDGGSAAGVCGMSADACEVDWLKGVVDDRRKVRVPFVVRPSRRDLFIHARRQSQVQCEASHTSDKSRAQQVGEVS